MHGQIIWSPGVSLANLERDVILTAFRFFRENKTATANSLGIAVNTLSAKLERYTKEQEEHKERQDEQRIKDREFLERSRGIVGRDSHNTQPIPQQHQENGKETDDGLYSQPASAVAAQQPVSLPERGEIQELLPAKAASGGVNRRR